jgi:formamidopyrimidine-DNA glycosylase
MKCEILYDCKLSPYRNINSIDDVMINNLYKSILKITDINIKADGRAIQLFKVYLNKDKDEYGNKVIKEKTPDGRTTYWVKEIQK